MMLPEEQAKTKWCPLVRYVHDGEDVTSNRDVNFTPLHGEPTNCLGSDCMAWRWTQPMFDGPDSYISEPGPKGYCGLAGLPPELKADNLRKALE
jgi:hypothetical protein